MIVKNYFKLFNLPESLEIPPNQLDTAYYSLIRATNNPNLINTAYTTLKSDISRAKHLLNIKNIKPINKLNSCFINFILQSQEKILKGNKKEIEDLKVEIKEKIEKCKNKFEEEGSIEKWNCLEKLKRMAEDESL